MSKSLLRFAVLGITCLTLSACGGGRNPDQERLAQTPETQKVGNQKVDVLTGESGLTFRSGALGGTGLVRFMTALEKPESANNYSLQFTLVEGGKLTLIANANRDLAGGIEVEMSRPFASKQLQVIATAGSDRLDLTDRFSDVDASSVVKISFDLHNDHGDSVHMVAWNDTTGLELLEDLLRSKGFGANWGLKLQNANVQSVELAGPRSKE